MFIQYVLIVSIVDAEIIFYLFILMGGIFFRSLVFFLEK